MSEAGTLLSDLDSAKPNDRDLVDSILSDMNQVSGSNPLVGMGGGAPPPPAGVRMPIQTVPSNAMTHPNASDPAVATAHMIGRDHPTEADFQRMMMAAQGPLPFNAMAPQMQQAIPSTQVAPQVYEEPKKNWQGQWIDELKQPIAVAIIVFVMTLPAFNLLVSHYAPNLLRPGGDLNTIGMLVRAGIGGLMYWVLQRVISPLLSI
jgi:hypothetical protein